MWESADELGWIVITVSGRSFNNLCYEDDIVLIATSVSGLQYPINKASEVSKEYSLDINT